MNGSLEYLKKRIKDGYVTDITVDDLENVDFLNPLTTIGDEGTFSPSFVRYLGKDRSSGEKEEIFGINMTYAPGAAYDSIAFTACIMDDDAVLPTIINNMHRKVLEVALQKRSMQDQYWDVDIYVGDIILAPMGKLVISPVGYEYDTMVLNAYLPYLLVLTTDETEIDSESS